MADETEAAMNRTIRAARIILGVFGAAGMVRMAVYELAPSFGGDWP